MDILTLVVPVVGAFGAFLLALLAFKQRTLLDFFGRGIDQTQALTSLPEKDKLDGLEIIENTLKIEAIKTGGLNADQTHSIILETLRDKRRHAYIKFVAYLAFAAMVGFIGLAFLYYSLFYDTRSKIETAISDDKEVAADILSRFDFHSKDDPELVRKLASETQFGKADGTDAYDKLMDKICSNPDSLTCNQVIRDLRQRASKREAPFNDVGIPVRFGTVSGKDQPKRFTLHVSPSFQYARRVVQISYKGRKLVLYAEPKMGPLTDTNFVHLNIVQADTIRAPRANDQTVGGNIGDPYEDSAFIVAIEEADPKLYDPNCPTYWNEERNPSLCSLEDAIPLSQYLRVAANFR